MRCRPIHCHPSTITHPLSPIHYHPSTITHPLSPIHYHSSTVTHPLSPIHYHPSTVTHPLSPIHYHPCTITHSQWSIRCRKQWVAISMSHTRQGQSLPRNTQLPGMFPEHWWHKLFTLYRLTSSNWQLTIIAHTLILSLIHYACIKWYDTMEGY